MEQLIFSLINHFKYLGIFIGTFIEGPAIGMISGFLIKIGYLNVFLVYLSHVFGDLAADYLYYSLGYYSQRIFLGRFRISDNSINRAKKIEKYFRKHPSRVIILGKLTHIFGLPILLGVGFAHYSPYKFVFLDLIATLIKSAILISIGFYFGYLWEKIDNFIFYFGVLGIAVIVLALIIYVKKNH